MALGVVPPGGDMPKSVSSFVILLPSGEKEWVRGVLDTSHTYLHPETNIIIMRTLLPLRVIYKRWKPSSRNHPLTLRMCEYCFRTIYGTKMLKLYFFVANTPPLHLVSFERNATSQGKTQQRHG